MKVLVTGAAGYIGRHVVARLLDLGHEVLASDISPKGIDGRARYCDAPIFGAAEDLFEKLGSPDACIHLAWRNGFVHNAPNHMRDLSGHVQFCQTMMESGLRTLSVMGSMHEVGYWEGAIDENTPCNPLSQYGVAKNALRQSLLLTAQQTPCSLRWLRAFYITGDEARSSSIFAKIIAAAAEGKKEFPFTSGRNKCDFIDVDELAKMIVAATLQNEIEGVINVCTGEPVSLGERVERFIRENALDIRLRYGAYPDRPYDSPGVWGDASRIRRIMEREG